MEQFNLSDVKHEFQQPAHATNEDSFISKKEMVIFNWVFWGVIAMIVDVFGIISNIINIVCFVKQGFKDSINVSLTGLAISDLCCLLPLIWANISYTPVFGELDLPFDIFELQYMTSAITHMTFTRISSWMTATITLERCLCVTLPLKVKDIVTPRRMCVVTATIFVVFIASASPQYFIYRLTSKFYPDRNKTLLGIDFTEELANFENISYPINYFILPFISFVIISVCTTVLVTELKIKSKWRQKSASSEEAAKLTSSNKRVVKMVVMISTLFICCFIPICLSCLAVVVVPEFSINGKNFNLVLVIGGVSLLLESINSSANIFIYYHMSSKYRDIFREIVIQLRVGPVC